MLYISRMKTKINLATFTFVLACLGQLAVSNPQHRWNSNGRSARNGVSHSGASYQTLGIQPGSSPQGKYRIDRFERRFVINDRVNN